MVSRLNNPSQESPPPQTEDYELALELGGLAIWDYEVDSGLLRGSAALARLFNDEFWSAAHPLQTWILRVVAEDQAATQSEFAQLAQGQLNAIEHRFRLLMPDDSKRWFQLRAGLTHFSEAEGRRLLGVVQDVTSQKEAEIAWMESERSARQLMESTSAIPWQLDLDLDSMTYVGPQAEAWVGYPLGYYYEVGFWQRCLHPEDRARVVQHFWQTPVTRQDQQIQFRLVTAEGREVWAQAVYNAGKRQSGGRILRGFIMDITEQVQAELRLIQAHDRLQLLLDSAPVAIITTNDLWAIEMWNPAAERIFGWSTSQVQDRECPGIPEDRKSEMADLMRRLHAGEKIVGHETVRLNQKGQRLFVSLSMSPLFNDQGRLSQVLVTCEDVTSKLLAMETLRESENQLRAVIEKSHVGICIVDERACYEFINPAYARLLGYEAKELLGTRLEIFDGAHQRDAGGTSFSQAMEGRLHEEARTELQVMRKEGRWVTMDVSWARFLGADFSPRLVIFLLDVTERKEFIEALRLAKQKAEKATLDKSEFLAHMTHEIRTPMNSVLGLSEALLSTTLQPAQHLMVDSIQRTGNTLLELTNRLLDYSKAEAGYLSLEMADFDLQEVILDVVRMIEPLAQTKRVGFHYQINTSGLRFHGDSLRLRQVLINLLGNAIKFTEQGSVRLRVTQLFSAEIASTAGRLKFEVFDTGIGLSEDTKEKLFSAYRQGDVSIARRFGGTGLGLAISQRFVDMMGGRIEIESTLGQGSTFSFIIELAQSESLTRDLSHEPEPHFQGENILVIDDHLPNLEVAKHQLKLLGCQAFLASNLKDGEQILAQEKISLILLDLRLGEISGLHVASQLRKKFKETTALPIIGFSADEWRPSSTVEGQLLDGFLLKPYRRIDLARTLARWILPQPAERQGLTEKAISAMSELTTEASIRKACHQLREDVGPENLHGVVQTFIRSARAEVQAIRPYIEGTDLPVIATFAHQLKGSSPAYGANGLAILAERLYDAMASNQPLSAREALWQSIKNEVDRVEILYQNYLGKDFLGVLPKKTLQ
jgi:PAS domain S-box-containing protein